MIAAIDCGTNLFGSENACLILSLMRSMFGPDWRSHQSADVWVEKCLELFNSPDGGNTFLWPFLDQGWNCDVQPAIRTFLTSFSFDGLVVYNSKGYVQGAWFGTCSPGCKRVARLVMNIECNHFLALHESCAPRLDDELRWFTSAVQNTPPAPVCLEPQSRQPADRKMPSGWKPVFANV